MYKMDEETKSYGISSPFIFSAVQGRNFTFTDTKVRAEVRQGVKYVQPITPARYLTPMIFNFSVQRSKACSG